MNVSILLKVVDECIDLIAHTLHCDVPKYVCLVSACHQSFTSQNRCYDGEISSAVNAIPVEEDGLKPGKECKMSTTNSLFSMAFPAEHGAGRLWQHQDAMIGRPVWESETGKMLHIQD